MSEPLSSSSISSPDSSLTTTVVTNLDDDSWAKCTSYLSLRDVCNLAMTCKPLKRAAYSDAIWHRFYRETWPQQIVPGFQPWPAMREAYLDRFSAIQKFKFVDPRTFEYYIDRNRVNHILLQKDQVILSKGSLVQLLSLNQSSHTITLTGHKARVTCMRLFPLNEAHGWNVTQARKHVLITSSCDRSIRLWWKNSCHRCFRVHTGPVTVLSDKLLGDVNAGIFASGGEDGTVRLWSLNLNGGKGQHALKATFHGHEKPVKLMSVAGHKTSLLVTIANDSKVRVWDSTAASGSHSSCCVGMSSVPGAPVGMKCHDHCVYIAAGSSVHAIDLRTMKKAFTAATCRKEVQSLEILPSESLVCTGAKDRALIWDVRKSKEFLTPGDSLAELEGHSGPVTLIHMDAHKVVTGGPLDSSIHIWDSETFSRTNSLRCCDPSDDWYGCSAMAVDGARIVTASSSEEEGLVRYRDFTYASSPTSCEEDEHGSRFWNVKSSYSDSDPEQM